MHSYTTYISHSHTLGHAQLHYLYLSLTYARPSTVTLPVSLTHIHTAMHSYTTYISHSHTLGHAQLHYLHLSLTYARSRYAHTTYISCSHTHGQGHWDTHPLFFSQTNICTVDALCNRKSLKMCLYLLYLLPLLPVGTRIIWVLGIASVSFFKSIHCAIMDLLNNDCRRVYQALSCT